MMTCSALASCSRGHAFHEQGRRRASVPLSPAHQRTGSGPQRRASTCLCRMTPLKSACVPEGGARFGHDLNCRILRGASGGNFSDRRDLYRTGYRMRLSLPLRQPLCENAASPAGEPAFISRRLCGSRTFCQGVFGRLCWR